MRTTTLRHCASLPGPAAGLSRILVGLVLVGAGLGCQGGGTINNNGGGNGGGKGGGGNGGGGGITIGTSGHGGNTGPTSMNTKNCGDGVLDKGNGEACDDGNTNSGDGCNKLCQLEANYLCETPGQPCTNLAVCGNGYLTSDETCDDGNTKDGDGCSADCMTVEPGYQCRVPGKRCTPLCGDGKVIGSEACDDGNSDSGDGCSSTCQIEPGADCPKTGGACKMAKCGNGVVEKTELCDCGTDPANLPKDCKAMNGLFYGDGKGCSKTCTIGADLPGQLRQDPGLHLGLRRRQSRSRRRLRRCQRARRRWLFLEVQGGGWLHVLATKTSQDSTDCARRGIRGHACDLPVIYRDFQPENVSSGGHPDFSFFGTKFDGSNRPPPSAFPTRADRPRATTRPRAAGASWPTICSTASRSQARRRPAPASSATGTSAISSRIPGDYTQAGNDSPLSDGAGASRVEPPAPRSA